MSIHLELDLEFTISTQSNLNKYWKQRNMKWCKAGPKLLQINASQRWQPAPTGGSAPEIRENQIRFLINCINKGKLRSLVAMVQAYSRSEAGNGVFKIYVRCKAGNLIKVIVWEGGKLSLPLMWINFYEPTNNKKIHYWKLVITPTGHGHTCKGAKGTSGPQTSPCIKENMTTCSVLNKTENIGSFSGFSEVLRLMKEP